MKPKVHSFSEPEKYRRELEIKTDEQKRRKASFWRKSGLIAGIAVVIAFLFFASYVNFTRRPVDSGQTNGQYFEIKEGQSSWQIAQSLQDQKLIRSKLSFFILVKIENRKALQAGFYNLAPSLSTTDIADKIQNGQVDAYSVTIPEGYRVLQIARLLQEKTNINANDFISAALGTEGTLFPDTYVFPRDLEVSKIIEQMRDDYNKRTAKLKPTADQLVLASMVEREAKNDSDRPKVAAVFLNRLNQNMPMQSNPTVRYALDSQTYLTTKTVDFTFWKEITRSDYQNLSSAFNTYEVKGLPPAPICNPGLKSIEAAINPQQNFTALYFFQDSNGQIHFSDTYQQQMDLIKQFGLAG